MGAQHVDKSTAIGTDAVVAAFNSVIVVRVCNEVQEAWINLSLRHVQETIVHGDLHVLEIDVVVVATLDIKH